MRSPKILLVAGEASGDQHAARLVAALREHLPAARFFGLGGPALAAQGLELCCRAEELAVVGLVEVFQKLPRLWRTLARLRRFLKEERPDLAILVDFPDFNFQVARLARFYRVPVLYYISPQVWAWRRYRVYTLARLVDRLVVIFPFEEDFYRRYGVPVTYVGHPLLDALPQLPPRPELRAALGLLPRDLAIALLPGSRQSEIDRLLPLQLAAAALLQARLPACRFLLPLAPGLSPGAIQPYLAKTPIEVAIFQDQTYQVLAAADLALIASGTATLEAALFGTPMVIMYCLNPLSYYLGRLLIRVPYIGMANLIAEEELFPELVQHEATPDRLAAAALKLLTDPAALARIRFGLHQVLTRLGGRGASRRAATVALELLNRPPRFQIPAAFCSAEKLMI